MNYDEKGGRPVIGLDGPQFYFFALWDQNKELSKIY
jgi:hypothetical protein